MKEEWRLAETHIGEYEVSSFGRIRNRVNGKLRALTHARYVQFNLRDKQSRCGYRMYSVHRLVAIAFIPNPLNKRTVNHKDGDRFNNHVSNLEWATYSENVQHSFNVLDRVRPKTWLGKFGENHNRSKNWIGKTKTTENA